MRHSFCRPRHNLAAHSNDEHMGQGKRGGGEGRAGAHMLLEPPQGNTGTCDHCRTCHRHQAGTGSPSIGRLRGLHRVSQGSLSEATEVASAQKMLISAIPPMPIDVSISPHWSQKGSKVWPHSAEQMSFAPGYQSSPQLLEAQPARHASELLISSKWANTVEMEHSSVSTGDGGVWARHGPRSPGRAATAIRARL